MLPIRRMAGNPTAIIFRDGADLVIIPNPILTSKREIIIGNASKSPPEKTSGVNSSNESSNGNMSNG
jgi:hypothetical protein